MCCTKCGSQNVIKNGFVKGQQRYRCKNCCYQFIPTRHHGKSVQEKLTAVLLYINGLSLRTISKLLKVSNVSVLDWVSKYALKNYEKPAPKGEAVIIELDEMWHFIKSKKINCEYGKHTIVLILIDWECGKRDKYTLLKLIEKLKRWNVDIYSSDKWEVYREVQIETNKGRNI